MKFLTLFSAGLFLWVVTGLSGCTYHTLFPTRDPGQLVSSPGSALPRTPGLLGTQALAIDRLKASLPAPRLEITPEVHSELADAGNLKFVRDSLDRGKDVLPLVRLALAEEGVPEDLLSLAIIESGFRSDARSPAGAVGMWQFMKGTARLYGLNVNLIRDEREDPLLASVAAARHLRELFLIYKDWYLAVAAYNAGIGSINGAIRSAQTDDFWTLSRSGKIKKETTRFVSRFIATSLLVKSQATGIMQARRSGTDFRTLG